MTVNKSGVDPALPKEPARQRAIEYIKACVAQHPLPRDLDVQAAVTDIYREFAAVGQPALQALRSALNTLRLAQRWLANCVPVAELDGPKPLPVIAEEIAKLEAVLASALRQDL